jgi:uncharacterized membrane protein YhaH (DUF805 family)
MMKRKDYWISILIMWAVMFAIGFISAWIAYPDEPIEIMVVAQLGAMVWLWIIGAARMQDAGHSAWWAIFAPTLLGMIVIGCLASKENGNDL